MDVGGICSPVVTGRFKLVNLMSGAALQSALDRIPLGLRGILYYSVFLVMILVVLPYAAMQFDRLLPALSLQLPSWTRYLGWAVFAAFLMTYTACSWHLMSRGRGAYVEFDPPKEFVATGPFQYCRNPIAACVLGMIFGEAVGLSSSGVLMLFLVGLPIAHAQVVLLEEPLLRKRFGAQYGDYVRSVPRWIPRFQR